MDSLQGPARPTRPSRELPSLPLETPVNASMAPQPPQAPSTATNIPASPISVPAEDPAKSEEDSLLTPLRAHYLKKELIYLQLHREFTALMEAPSNNVSSFSYLGPPFTAPPKNGPRLDLPFLRYMFRQFVLSFPFLAAAPKNFFPDKLQPFLASLLSRNLSSQSALDDNPGNSEEAERYKLLTKLERNFTMVMTSGTKLAEAEEVVRLTQSDLDRLERLARKRAGKANKEIEVFEVNIVGVRTVVERGRVRSKAHEEFLVRTRRSNHPDIFVSRRYGDFRTLAEELRKAHPLEEVPRPPAKDRSYVNVASPISSTPPTPAGSRATISRSQRHYEMPGFYSSASPSADSLQSYPNSPNSATSFGQTLNGLDIPQHPSKLAREKNRLTLRSYLHTLLSSNTLGSSPVLRSFLTSSPTRLSEEELDDAKRREEADRLREAGRKQFAQEIKERVDGLREAVRSVKGELLGQDGLAHIFATIKRTPNVRDLPGNYRAVVEWARISLASTVFQHFVAADKASENFSSLKRTHGLMPYFMLKAALKISNPVAMIRGVLDLFLATPFGGRSLLQRMFTGSLMEEVKALEEDIEAVKTKVEDPAMCEKVRLFIYAPKEIQAIFKADAAAENINILTVVLRSGDQPSLSRSQLQRVMRAHHAHKEYLKYTENLTDSDDDSGPQNDDAWLYEDLHILAKLYTRLKDREQLISLIFEGTTADLLKDIITIFYSPLAQVYRAASIADSLSDVQSFINDLIRTVEQCEELSQQDPSQTVQTFVDLIQRHEQAFYHFVHKVHSKGEGLFSSLLQWIDLFLTLMREGFGAPISLEFLLPHKGEERDAIMHEIDEVARYHYKLKLAYEAKVRRRFGRTQSPNGSAPDDGDSAQMVNNVVEGLSFGELVKGDADDLAAEQTDDSGSSEEEDSDEYSDDDGSEEYESGSDSEEEAAGGSSTEGGVQTPNDRSYSTLGRSTTVGHSPKLSQKIPAIHPPSPSHTSSSPPPHSMWPGTLDSSTKELPMLPPRLNVMNSRSQPSQPTSLRQKKKAEGPKPPALKHVPQLLPLFVEMMRPLLRPQAPTKTQGSSTNQPSSI